MRFVVFLVVLLFVAFAAAKNGHTIEQTQFVAFQQKYNKVYSSNEYSAKFETFKANLGVIAQLNQKAKLHKSDTKFGVNEFADLSAAEFRKYYLNAQVAKPDASLPMAPLLTEEVLETIPTAFDWRTKGAVTGVKNQGQCGSCWSFSTTGNIEGQWYLAGNTLVGLSEQNLVDCDHQCMEYDGQKSCDAGCDGGLQPNAYRYVIENGGLDSENSYPYLAVTGDSCKFKSGNVAAKISNFTMIPQNETQMAGYLATHGPLAIAADAAEWQFYIGGVFDLPCGQSLDHGILIVGFSAEKNIFGHLKPYWIVKNSWGASWGEQGYLYLGKGKNLCGVSDFVSTSTINASL
ncbi:hypothetical protein DICPUDRAFT_96752 [Dictyostelium purpureum]|uniref:Uncharacterized protein n=1 Tax=Dictyostelium purpureum TaxID=5786 RepID=F0ZAW8_DICPU|nr:uncharacterized protein DICPUDRAFT_96752 [Dictyostelium purpureum]EGC38873.1 hypothetical protein DICPUDRAFT_96752 [Dictyostelium purpureum]|eukprot:XP_003284553.1 hypothetical protein DICPUDRAFT_96752 [Dictyostelium purpureum]